MKKKSLETNVSKFSHSSSLLSQITQPLHFKIKTALSPNTPMRTPDFIVEVLISEYTCQSALGGPAD